MPIYTKRGDHGTTSLFGQKRKRRKDNPRIVAYGTVDELNSQLGLAASLLSAKSKKLKLKIEMIQEKLLTIGSQLATPPSKKPSVIINREDVKALEKEIDNLEKGLPKLRNFVFPGGSRAGAAMHVARSVCRRAEREVVSLARKERVNPLVLVYLNRLADALFMLARQINSIERKPERKWRG